MGKRKHKARQKFLDSLTEEEKIKEVCGDICPQKMERKSYVEGI